MDQGQKKNRLTAADIRFVNVEKTLGEKLVKKWEGMFRQKRPNKMAWHNLRMIKDRTLKKVMAIRVWWKLPRRRRSSKEAQEVQECVNKDGKNWGATLERWSLTDSYSWQTSYKKEETFQHRRILHCIYLCNNLTCTKH